MNRHEIPTHLNVEDKAFAGLTMRQLLTVAIGLALAYGAATEPPLPMPLRLIAATLVLAGVAVFSLWRPAGRPLEDWSFVLLRYWAVPRIAVWRPRLPQLGEVAKVPKFEVVLPEPLWMANQRQTQEGERHAIVR